MFCPNCGSEVEDGSKFCQNCGFKLDKQNNSRENNEKQIDHSNNKKIDTQNKTSKKVIKKSKFPIFLIIFIVFVIGILGLFYFVIKENPINYVMDKISNGQFILFGSKSNERNLSDKINEARGVAVNGYVQKIDGFSIDDFDTVTFGTYPQDDVTGNSKEPIEWIVLDKVGDKALLMSKKVLDKKPFCNTNRHSNWEESDLRSWLNNDFYNQAFSDKEKESILTESIKNSRLSLQQFPELNDKSNISKISDGNLYNKNGDDTSYTLNWYSKTDNITYTNDNVFIPSYEELNKYFGVEGFDGDGITEWWQADHMIQNIYCDFINNKLTENEYISQVKNILKSYSMDEYNESLFDEYEKLKYLYLDDYSWANKTKVLRAKGTPYSGLNFKAIGRDFLLLNNETGGVPYWLRVESEYSIIDYESNTKANTNLVIDGEGKAYTYYDRIPIEVESNEIGVRPCIWVSFNNENNEDGHIVYPVDYSCYNEILKNLRDVNALIAHNEIIDVSQGEYLGYQLIDVDKNGVDELVLFRGYIDGNPYIYDIWTIKNGRMSKLSINGFTYNFKTDYGKDYKKVYYALNNGDILNVSQYNMDSIPSYRILGINKNKFTEKQKYFYYDYNNSWGFNDEDNKYQEISKAEGDNAINDYLSKVSFFDADLKDGLIDSNDISALGDNVHIEGVDVYQNSDGSIQIGGIPNDGAKLLQSGDSTDINNEYKYDYSKPPIYSKAQVVLTNSDIKDAKPKRMKDDYGQIQYVIDITLNDIGKQKFAEVTERNLGQPIYIIYDGDIISAPYVQSVITDGKTQITGLESQDSATQLAEIINNKNGNIEFVEGNLTWPLLSEDYGNENLTDTGDRENYNHSNISDDLSNKIRNAKLVTEYPTDTTVDEMDTVTFGSYPQSDVTGNTKDPIEWIVLNRDGNRALLLSKYKLDRRKYNDIKEDTTWERSTIRSWLNNTFYSSAFTDNEKLIVINVNIINNDNVRFGTNGGEDTYDKVFLLSIDEVNRYLKNNTMRDTLKTNYSKVNSGWWLRSSGSKQNQAANVSNIGALNEAGYSVGNNMGIRPSIWVDTSAPGSNGDTNVSSDVIGKNSQKNISFNKNLLDEYNKIENIGKCKFDSDGNLWIESWPYLGSGPGEGVTIKYANGNVEHYEYSGAASAYDGGGHIDIYATEINGVIKSIEVRDENIKDDDKEFVNKIYEMIERFNNLKNEFIK